MEEDDKEDGREEGNPMTENERSSKTLTWLPTCPGNSPHPAPSVPHLLWGTSLSTPTSWSFPAGQGPGEDSSEPFPFVTLCKDGA